MTTKPSHKKLLVITQEFNDAIWDYQEKHNYASWNEAALALMVKGLEVEGIAAPPIRKWGVRITK